MILLGNLLIGIAQVLSMLVSFYMFLFIARAVLSWVSPDPYNPIVRTLYALTDPVLFKIKRYIPPVGMIDLSVFVAIIALLLVQSIVCQTLADYGVRLKSPVAQTMRVSEF